MLASGEALKQFDTDGTALEMEVMLHVRFNSPFNLNTLFVTCLEVLVRRTGK